jgi:UDP:flavonoid glycosyltransferase YjiC (YdhE family)
MRGPFGRVRDAVVSRLLASSAKGGMKIWNELREREGLPPWSGNLFDIHNETSTAMFMVGCPGMDFPRDDWPEHFEFVGPLVAHRSSSPTPLSAELDDKIAGHDGQVIVVAQGTIDNRDPDKLFIPALEALADTPHLVVVTTGGRHTEMLRARFPQDNVVVEDWVDYGALMPHAGLFITSGGYGSVMQALTHRVPLLLAGKREGKEDICARMDYRGLGLSLGTERPTAEQIARGVERVLGTPTYRENVERLYGELSSYDPCDIIERRIVAGHEASSTTSGAVARAS